MKKHFIRTVATLLVVVLTLTAAPLNGFVGLDFPEFNYDNIFSKEAEAATTASGTCGENLTWTLKDDGTLTISGTGLMTDYLDSISAPWYSYRYSIKSVIIDWGVTSIGSSAFSWCSNLTSVTVPTSVTSIGNDAFYRCTALTAITLPDSIENIGSYAFSCCYALSSISIPPKVKLIEVGTFYYCSSLPAIEIPEGITEISSYAFSNCKSLISVSLPDSLTSIAGEVFDSCVKLQSIDIPKSVMNIGNKAFYYCYGLTTVTFEEGCQLSHIGFYTFGNCIALKSVAIPDSVTYLDGGAFSNCQALETVTFAKNNQVTKIGNYAFEDCTSLTSVNLEDCIQLAAIGNSAFSHCEALTSIKIPDSVTSLYKSAFSHCYSLTTATLGNSITSIGEYAFFKSQSLLTITIPASVTYIGDYAFVDCDSLSSISVHENNTRYSASDGVLYNKEQTILYVYPNGKQETAFQVPDSVTRIGTAFYHNKYLTSIIFGDDPQLESIGGSAFHTCESLVSVCLPNSVKSIDSYAFYACNNLRDVYYVGTKVDWQKISVKSGNTPLTNAAIHYDTPNGYKGIYGQTETDTLVLTTRNTDSWLSGTVGNESLAEKSGSLNWKMANSTAKIGDKTFSQDENKNITVEKDDLTDDVVISHSDYYNYIIPKAVADSFMGTGLTNVFEYTAYMKKEVKNGKPYVSTVFARQDGTDGAYLDVCREKLTVADGLAYTFYITADNLDENATYYISQDEAHRIESSTGYFSTDQVADKLQDGKDTYVYFVTASGVVSDTVQIKLNFENPEENSVVKELQKGKLNIGGKEGLSVTLPEDWLLVGGSTIDLCDWSFPVGVQVEGNAVRVSVGFDLWTKTSTTETSFSSIDKSTQQEYISKSTTEYKTSTLWENVKSGLKGSANAFKNAKDKADAVKIKKQLCQRYGVDVADLGSSNVGKTRTNVSAMGYIEGSIVNGKFIVTDMLISVAGEFILSYTVQLSAGYLGLEGGGKLTVTTNWSRVTADVNLPLEFGVAVNVTPEIKARGGVGWDGIASAGVYGKGTMPIDIVFTDKKLSVAITGEFGYEAQVLIWSTGEKALLSGTFGPKEVFFGKSSVERARTLQAHGITTEDVGSAQDVYTLTDRVQSSAWLGDNSFVSRVTNRVGVSSSDELTFKTLQTDVFKLADAKIITAGNTTLAVWVSEDAKRDDCNRLKLVYSVYDALLETWNEPKAVYDDGFMDASPVLATDGENIYVAWQKYCKTFTAENSADIADVLATAEIYTAKYDAQTGAFINATRITNDAVYDYRPALTVVDGEAVTVFATDSNNAVLSADGNHITKVENGTKTVLADNVSTVNNLACAVVDNAVEIAYSVDTDGDLQTTNDIGVFYGTASFTEFKKFYANDPITNLVYADFDGETTLFVSDGVNIYYNDNGTTTAILEEETIISSQLQAVNESEGLSFYWLSSTASGNELYTCGHIDGAWSNAICLSERRNEFSNLAVTVADSQVIGIVNETVITFDEETQTYTKGNTNFVSFKENDCFDLAMISVDLDETHLSVGETAFLEIMAENVGNVKAGSLTFTVTDTNGTEKEYLVEEELLPGKSVLWQIPYTVPENIAQTNLTVTVSTDTQTDVNTDNNAVSFEANKASLVVSANGATETDGIYILSADITNTNFATAENVYAAITFDEQDGTDVSSVSIGDLAKNELAVAEFAFTENDLVFNQDGIATVYLSVSADNAADSVAAFAITKNTPDYILGDIDNDGSVTTADARTALRAAVGLEELSEVQTPTADVDTDGNITTADARSILRAAVGLEDPADWLTNQD